MKSQNSITHGVQSSTLADILERVLDKGIVIAGDIKIKLVDIELLTIQIRLVVCSVDKAVEMGMNWWVNDSNLVKQVSNDQDKQIEDINKRILNIEKQFNKVPL